jgi:hypothetical protein
MRHAFKRPTFADHDSWPWLGRTALVALLAASLLAALGLPPVDLHGPLHRFGIMDPFCGGTRAARFFMTGDLQSAWRFNPGIFALSTFLGLGLARWAYGRATGRWLHLNVSRTLVVIAIVIGLSILEINQQLNAELLVRR